MNTNMYLISSIFAQNSTSDLIDTLQDKSRGKNYGAIIWYEGQKVGRQREKVKEKVCMMEKELRPKGCILYFLLGVLL